MKAIVCTVPSDSHSWNLVFMDLYLREKGFETKNLGVCTSAEDLVICVRDFHPDMVVISSINGHAYLEAPQIIDRLRESGLFGSSYIVIGGKIGVKGDENIEYREFLLRYGFDAVFIDMKNNDGIADFGDFINESFWPAIERKKYA